MASGSSYGLLTRMFFVSVGIDYGQPWRRTFGDNIVYTDWQRDNYYYAVQQQVCIRDHMHCVMGYQGQPLTLSVTQSLVGQN